MTYMNTDETTNLFEQVVRECESSGDLYVEWAKINIAEQIAKMMEQQEISKAELARRLNKSRAYVTQILQGTNFTIESLVRIATTLDCEFDLKLKRKSSILYWEAFNKADSADIKETQRSKAMSLLEAPLESAMAA